MEVKGTGTVTPPAITGSASVTLPSFGVTAGGEMWLTMTGPLMQSAALFARKAFAIEQAHASTPATRNEQTWHRSCVLSGIVTACAAVEALANETIVRALESAAPSPFDQAGMDYLKSRWPSLEKTGSVLDKLELALYVGKALLLDAGSEPRQSAALAFSLRNEIVHYKARQPSTTPTSFEKKLAGRFATNPFEPSTTQLFPYGCMSHGCIEWVIASQIQLANEFISRLSLPALQHPNWDFRTR